MKFTSVLCNNLSFCSFNIYLCRALSSLSHRIYVHCSGDSMTVECRDRYYEAVQCTFENSLANCNRLTLCPADRISYMVMVDILRCRVFREKVRRWKPAAYTYQYEQMRFGCVIGSTRIILTQFMLHCYDTQDSLDWLMCSSLLSSFDERQLHLKVSEKSKI